MTETTTDDALAFDANAALEASRAVWLKLGRTFAAVIDNNDWIDSPKQAAEAMEWAAQAEACFWRATGDMDCPDIDKWLPAFRRTEPLPGESA